MSLSATAWEPTTELTCEDWILQGERLGSIGRGVAWWIGDWVNYGNARFGEKYSRAARITGYDVQTLMNMCHVASRFSADRRRETLSWSHHVEVAALAVGDQDAMLDDAERDGLSVRGLRERVRGLGRADRRGPRGTEISRSTTASRPTAASRSETGTGGPAGESVAVCPNCGCTMVGDSDFLPSSRAT